MTTNEGHKERPILFSGPMVRAILSGRKTQTRRVVKWPLLSPSDGVKKRLLICDDVPLLRKILQGPFRHPHTRFCPYGLPGDRMWVKETHFESRKWRHAPLFAAAPDFIYRADYDYREELSSVIGCHHWRPSIFMKREASRIALEIVSVRVERLQEISEGDAVAEGIEPVQMPTGEVMYDNHLERGAMMARAVSSYASLWESINGAGSWSLNPWVWVVEFKRI